MILLSVADPTRHRLLGATMPNPTRALGEVVAEEGAGPKRRQGGDGPGGAPATAGCAHRRLRGPNGRPFPSNLRTRKKAADMQAKNGM